MGSIFNIQRFCLHDGDGIRTTVFLKGCPLRCIWCHNPEGLETCPIISFAKDKCVSCGRCLNDCVARHIVDGEVALNTEECVHCGKCVSNCLCGANELFGREVSSDEVLAEVLRDKMFYKTSGGGLTISGGEPSMQAEFAIELIEKAKEAGVSSFIETSGIGSREFYKKCLELGVVFLYDIKCMDSVRHKSFTGVGNEKILDNLEYLFVNGADIILRLPFIPGLNDTEKDIRDLSAFLLKNTGKYRYAQIMPYHSFGTGKAIRLGMDNGFAKKDATDEDKARWKKAFSDLGVDIVV